MKNRFKKPPSGFMDVELGEDWTGDHARVVEKVETRVKANAMKYGFIETD